MQKMTIKDYRELVDLLDGRIDELTKPIPSLQVLRFAEGIKSAEDDTYTAEDYDNLMRVQDIIAELLPSVLEKIRVDSIDDKTGWRFVQITASDGDHGLCAICREPFQHFDHSVQVHCLDMHPNAYHGVCRECVGAYAPVDFADEPSVDKWFDYHRRARKKSRESATDARKHNLIDAIRKHAESTHYFGQIVKKAPKWAEGAFGEWG